MCSSTKKPQGINPMDLCAPWSDYCFHNWTKAPNHNHQTLTTLQKLLCEHQTLIILPHNKLFHVVFMNQCMYSDGVTNM